MLTLHSLSSVVKMLYQFLPNCVFGFKCELKGSFIFPTLSLSKRQVVTAIVESGKNMSAEQKKTDRCPLLYEWHKKQYIGAAHGLAGIYYMLMQVGENRTRSV